MSKDDRGVFGSAGPRSATWRLGLSFPSYKTELMVPSLSCPILWCLVELEASGRGEAGIVLSDHFFFFKPYHFLLFPGSSHLCASAHSPALSLTSFLSL